MCGINKDIFHCLTKPLISPSLFLSCTAFRCFSHWKKNLPPERVMKVQPRWWGGTFSPRVRIHRPQPQMIMNDLQNCTRGGGWGDAKQVTDSDGWPQNKLLQYTLENERKAVGPDRKRYIDFYMYIFLLFLKLGHYMKEITKEGKKKTFSTCPHWSRDLSHQGEIETVNPVFWREKGLSQRWTCLNVNRSAVLEAETPPTVPAALMDNTVCSLQLFTVSCRHYSQQN